MKKEDLEEGLKVKSLIDFSGVPKGTIGIIEASSGSWPEKDAVNVAVHWQRHTKDPLIDWFSWEDLKFLEVLKISKTPRLNFSKNWAGKLDCHLFELFTTIKQDKGYWQNHVGNEVYCFLKDKYKIKGTLVSVLPLKLEEIGEELAQIDAGMPKKKLCDMLVKMYGENPKLQLLLIRRVY